MRGIADPFKFTWHHTSGPPLPFPYVIRASRGSSEFMNVALIVNCAIAPLAFLILCLPALRNPDARRWIPVIILMSVLDSVATLLPLYVHTLQFPNVHWNWGGKVLDIAVMLAAATIFILTRHFTAR